MKSFSDKTEIRKSKLFDHVTLENESKINKRVGSNKNMYAGKKCQKLKRVYMFIKQTRVVEIQKFLSNQTSHFGTLKQHLLEMFIKITWR